MGFDSTLPTIALGSHVLTATSAISSMSGINMVLPCGGLLNARQATILTLKGK